ncbi:MAG: GNAT family N-acetyltransferase [Pseudomonadota bacterium]
MPYSIRLFEHGDAVALADLTLAAIKCVGAARYSPEQVAAWASRHPGPDRFKGRAEEGAMIWVAVAENTPVAYCLLEPPSDGAAHLDMLYCDPAHTRKGLAPALLEKAEHYAREQKVARLFTEASELARPAFAKAGYIQMQRRDFTIPLDGKDVPIHNYAMEKRLS